MQAIKRYAINASIFLALILTARIGVLSGELLVRGDSAQRVVSWEYLTNQVTDPPMAFSKSRSKQHIRTFESLHDTTAMYCLRLGVMSLLVGPGCIALTRKSLQGATPHKHGLR